jgi:predicted alpha/beta-hydrolase family hydrolase
MSRVISAGSRKDLNPVNGGFGTAQRGIWDGSTWEGERVKIPGVVATSFDPRGESVGTAVLVPGSGYPPQAPLLFFAGQALLQHGWRVVHHWWSPPEGAATRELDAWVCTEVEGALPASGRALIVGKSLGTRAAPLAAARGLPAIWLTPLFGRRLLEAYGANPAPQLLVGGTADQLWDREAARALEGPTRTVVEVPDADHAMLVPGDSVRGVSAHHEVQKALEAWLTSAID